MTVAQTVGTLSNSLDAPRRGFKATLESMRTVTSRPAVAALLLLAATGGIGGALLLGWIAETVARTLLSSVLASSFPDFNAILIPLIVLILLGVVGNFVLWMSFTIKNPKARWIALSLSVPLPILIEIVDLPLRFYSVGRDFGLF